jgi:hypothetical protein
VPNVHHPDKTNTGDWWSPPSRYFPLKPKATQSLVSYHPRPGDTEIHILGGGGLGSEFFRPHVARLAAKPRKYKLVAWGVGVDTKVLGATLLDPSQPVDLFGDYFEHFDVVGTRVFSSDQRFTWVPCASCMHPAFFALRDRKPVRQLGVYQHKHRPIKLAREGAHAVKDNAGDNLLEKLEFLARHEYILTNTYHGVFWATLLARKVICLPFKSGLFSFRHRPTYSSGAVNAALMRSAVSYGNALEECRLANIEFYRSLTGRFGDI